MSEWMTALHFLRPHWLWALLALPALWALWRVRQRRGNVWQDVVDAHLLPHLLERGGNVVRGVGADALEEAHGEQDRDDARGETGDESEEARALARGAEALAARFGAEKTSLGSSGVY